MKNDHTSKRMAGALIMTAFLAAFFLMIAAYGPGSGASTAAAHSITSNAPAHDETETPEATETHHPEETRTRTPEATETHQGERTETPEPTETHEGEPTETHEPEETETPEATETHHPEETRTAEPTETHEVEPTETHEPEETETPEATETHHPERTETPHATRTGVPSPEPTEQGPVASNGNGTLPPASIPGTGSRTFAPTGKTVNGIFLQYWDKNGGLQQQGYPISNVMQEKSPLDGKVYTVQYFERSVFEFHPENAAPYNILLSQLGTFRYKSQYPTGVSGQIVNRTDATYFPQTNHYVGGTFLKYWQEHGGLAQQGYPLSDEFTEISPLDGKPYRVQYFERAVFELHPENAAPYNILLSQLGTFRYKSQYNGK